MAEEKVWYLGIQGQTYGPFSVQDLRTYHENGHVHTNTFAYGPGLSTWVAMKDIPALSAVFANRAASGGEAAQTNSKRNAQMQTDPSEERFYLSRWKCLLGAGFALLLCIWCLFGDTPSTGWYGYLARQWPIIFGTLMVLGFATSAFAAVCLTKEALRLPSRLTTNSRGITITPLYWGEQQFFTWEQVIDITLGKDALSITYSVNGKQSSEDIGTWLFSLSKDELLSALLKAKSKYAAS